MRLLATIFALCLSCASYATDTITAVTLAFGAMTNVTVHSDIDNARYSTCNILTPYTYTWNVDDLISVQANYTSTAWTLNDLSTAAVAVCIVRTVL